MRDHKKRFFQIGGGVQNCFRRSLERPAGAFNIKLAVNPGWRGTRNANVFAEGGAKNALAMQVENPCHLAAMRCASPSGCRLSRSTFTGGFEAAFGRERRKIDTLHQHRTAHHDRAQFAWELGPEGGRAGARAIRTD
jgi:hypothetical protein